MEEVSRKVHSRDCCDDEDRSENQSGEIAKASSILHEVRHNQLLGGDEHHEQEASGDHHMTARCARRCLASPLGLVERRSSQNGVLVGLVYPPVGSIARENP